MLGDWQVLRRFNRNIRHYLLFWALLAFGFGGIGGVLINLYLLRLGLTQEFLGLLIASGQVTWAAAALPAAMFGRRLGLRAALITANLICALGIGAFLLVELLPQTLWQVWLVGCWMLLWVGAALNSVNTLPFLMHVTSPEERNHAFAAQGIVMGMTGLVGSLVAGLLPGLFVVWLGGSLDNPAPYRHGLWLIPLSYLLCAGVWSGTEAVQIPEQDAAAMQAPRPLGLFIFLGLVICLQTAGEGAVRAFFNVYLDSELAVATARIGTIFGLAQLASVVMTLTVPRLLRRRGTLPTLVLATIGTGLALLLLAALPHWLPASLGFCAIMALVAITVPARSILTQELVPPQWRTTTAAIATIGVASGWAAAALLGGALAARLGFRSLFLVSGALALAAALLLQLYGRRRARQASLSAES